jgi:hypothetical protein
MMIIITSAPTTANHHYHSPFPLVGLSLHPSESSAHQRPNHRTTMDDALAHQHPMHRSSMSEP